MPDAALLQDLQISARSKGRGARPKIAETLPQGYISVVCVSLALGKWRRTPMSAGQAGSAPGYMMDKLGVGKTL